MQKKLARRWIRARKREVGPKYRHDQKKAVAQASSEYWAQGAVEEEKESSGAWKQWCAETMDQEYDSQDCRWFFWSGKLGWEPLQKSSWAKLDEMWFENNRSGEPCAEVMDVGGWEYKYTIIGIKLSEVKLS